MEEKKKDPGKKEYTKPEIVEKEEPEVELISDEPESGEP